MIGTILTIGTGVYVGLYLASKGCSYKAAMKPLQEASAMLRSKCGCAVPQDSCDRKTDDPETNECNNKENKQ
jgi:hypothetical protein